MYSPIFIIARFFIKKAVARYNLSATIFTLFMQLFTVSIATIKLVGIVPVIRVLRALPVILRSAPGALKRVEDLFEALRKYSKRGFPLNSIVLDAIFKLFNDKVLWRLIIFNLELFNKVYKRVFLPTIFLSILLPFFKWIIRMVVGLIFSALGIIFNEHLAAIPFLKDFALAVINLLDNYLPLHFLSYTSPTGELDNIELGPEATSKIYILGAVLVGLVTTLGLLVVTDIYYPGFTDSIPVLNHIVHGAHEFCSSIYSYITNWRDPDDGSSTITLGDNRSSSTSPSPSAGYHTPETSFSELAPESSTFTRFPDQATNHWAN